MVLLRVIIFFPRLVLVLEIQAESRPSCSACSGIVLSLRLEAKARLIAGQYFFDPSFLKGCAQITPERQRVLVKVFPSYDYIFQAS